MCHPLDEPVELILATHVSIWSRRARAAFVRLGVGADPTPDEVAERVTVVDLLKQPNCSRVTVNQISAVLRENGRVLQTSNMTWKK